MKRYTWPLLLIGLLLYTVFPNGCANTSTAPQGGPKDTLPPVLMETFPLYNTIGFPTQPGKKHTISFTFNEYVVLKEANKNVFLSPPLSKPVETKIRGKSVVVTFPEDLDSNTTYSLDLGAAIADNNEGNLMPQYIFSFSTGNTIDSLYNCGTVVDAKTMLPLKQITILFHKDMSDSAVFKFRPRAAAKTDAWGFFTVRNLAPGEYRVYAIEDLNNNNLYDPNGNERIAFLDSLVIPERVMSLDSLELQSLDMKDTLNCLARRSDFQLYLFKETPTRQVMKKSERLDDRMFYVTFSAPYPQVDTIMAQGLTQEDLLSQTNLTRDSIAFWIKRQATPDTLQLFVHYRKTDDSTKLLIEAIDTVRLPRPKPKQTHDRNGNAVEVKDTVAKFDFFADADKVEQNGIVMEFAYPLQQAVFDSIRFSSTDPKKQVKAEPYTVEQDSTNLRRYVMRPGITLLNGYEYEVKIPADIFVDINGNTNDSLAKRITLPSDETLSSITTHMQNVHGTYIVELVNEKRDKVFREFTVHADTSLVFPYIKKGKYSIRISNDANNNGMIDTGSVLERRQPEKVLLYRFGPDQTNESYLIDIPERADIEQTIDIQSMFQ